MNAPRPVPGVNAPRPGADEIVLTVPSGRHLCSSLEHSRLGRVAEVIVTFGQMGEPGWADVAFWPEVWGQSYALCGPCWRRVEPVVRRHRPALVVTGPLTPAPAGPPPQQQPGHVPQAVEGEAWRS